MSGVTGNPRIESRENYDKIVKKYTRLIKDFPGFISLQSSGSYNSDLSKTSFGDVDLIITINDSLYKSKKDIKIKLAEYLTGKSTDTIVPFISEKYEGKRYYNSGEIITVSYKVPGDIPACQIDNIIACSEEEANFKREFLDMPAEKQGLVLGLVKTVLLEEDLNRVFNRLKIYEYRGLTNLQEFEFNLSSVELQLRKVTYDKPGSFKIDKKEVVWRSSNWEDVKYLLVNYNLDLDFLELLKDINFKLTEVRSVNRMVGVFNSMISVKSGEVGTEKGANKLRAIDKVEETFRIMNCNPYDKLEEVRELFQDMNFFESVELMDEWTIVLRFRTNHKLFRAIRKVSEDGKIAGMKYKSSSYMDSKSIELSIPRDRKKFKIGDRVIPFKDGKPNDRGKKWEIAKGTYPASVGYNCFVIKEINKRKKEYNKFEMSLASYLIEKDENA
jgi:hypothetical protein